MSEKEQVWLDEYMATGDGKEATRRVFDCSEKTLASRTSQLKAKLALQIDKRLRESFAVNAVAAANIIKDLAFNAKSEPVKLKAACDLLDRGGYKPVNETRDLLDKADFNPEQAQAQMAELKRQLLRDLPAEELEAALKDIQGGQREH